MSNNIMNNLDDIYRYLDRKDLTDIINNHDSIYSIIKHLNNKYYSKVVITDECLNSAIKSSTEPKLFGVLDYWDVMKYITNRYNSVKFLERTIHVRYGSIPTMKKKITFTCGDKQYSYIEDFTDYINEIISNKCNRYSDTKELITEKNYYRYISDISVYLEDVDSYNGTHIVFGIVENAKQSEPSWFKGNKKEIYVDIESLRDK